VSYQASDTINILICLANKCIPSVGQLNQHYRIRRASTSSQVIMAATRYRPNLLLIDSMLEDIEGRYVVHALRLRERTKHIHVLILSDDLTPKRLMELYNSGADDVLSNGTPAQELIFKIDSILARQENNQNKHNKSLSEASTATISALTYASELGVLIEAAVNISRCTDIKELAENTLSSCERLELNGSMQFRLEDYQLEFSNNGVVTDLEKKLFKSSQHCAQRIVEHERRLFLNSQKFTLLIRNLPTHDPDKVGRYRDHLAMLVHITEARVHDIERRLALKNDRDLAINNTMKSAEEELYRVLELLKEHRNDSRLLVNELIANVESEMVTIFMDDKQEEKLVNLLETGKDRMTGFLDRYDTIDHCISNITGKLYSMVKAYD
jgi:CheY-like chemotaxis protein